MPQSRIVVFSLLFLWMAAAEATPQDMREIYTSTDGAGHERVYRVPEGKLLATKMWSPESEPPPLSISSAVAVALKSLSPRDTADVRVVQIDLISTGDTQEWRWFYRIELFDSPRTRRAEVLELLVLMDGSIVEPSPGRRGRGAAKQQP